MTKNLLFLSSEKVGCVFQNYALYRHLNVMDNITLALCKVFGMPGQLAREKALHVLQKLDMASHSAKYPSQLSGGQQQRVAWPEQWSPTQNSLFLMSRRLRLIRS